MTKILVLALFVSVVAADAQEKSEKFAVFVTSLGVAAPVKESLVKMLNASKPFEAVGKMIPAKWWS